MLNYLDSTIQGRPPLGAELQVALNLIPAHTWYAKASGALTFLNKRGSDYLGLPKDHPLRFGIDTSAEWDSHISLLHPDDHEETRRVWSTCLRTGCAGQVSFRIRNAEGGYRWFLSCAEPVRASDDGTLLYWIGISLDIEDRKQAEFYLAEGQRLAHMGSWAFNAAGFDYWSPELFQIHGLDLNRKAPTVEEYMAIVHPEDREFVAQAIRKMLADHRGFDFTKRIVRPGGEIRRVRCVGIAVSHGEKFQGFVGTGMDVTEQEQLTEELRRRERELRDVVDTIPAIVWSALPDGSNTYVNSRFVEYSGMSAEQLAGSGWHAATHPDDLQRHERKWLECVRTGEVFEDEVRFRRADGQYRWHLQRGVPLRDEDGNILKWYGVLTDIEDRKRAEKALQRNRHPGFPTHNLLRCPPNHN